MARGRTFKGKWGISGAQPGFGVRGKAITPGKRVTKEGVFPEGAGHVLQQ